MIFFHKVRFEVSMSQKILKSVKGGMSNKLVIVTLVILISGVYLHYYLRRQTNYQNSNISESTNNSYDIHPSATPLSKDSVNEEPNERSLIVESNKISISILDIYSEDIPQRYFDYTIDLPANKYTTSVIEKKYQEKFSPNKLDIKGNAFNLQFTFPLEGGQSEFDEVPENISLINQTLTKKPIYRLKMEPNNYIYTDEFTQDCSFLWPDSSTHPKACGILTLGDFFPPVHAKCIADQENAKFCDELISKIKIQVKENFR